MINYKRILKIIACCLLCFGCSSPKFYKELDQTSIKRLSGMKINDKELFTSLNDKFIDTSHIIYTYMYRYNKKKDYTVGLIFDVDNNKYYRAVFVDNGISEIEFIDSPSANSYETFVLKNYLEGNYDYLQNLHLQYTSSADAFEQYIYDLNLKNKVYKGLAFYSFNFFNGRPDDGSEEMKMNIEKFKKE